MTLYLLLYQKYLLLLFLLRADVMIERLHQLLPTFPSPAFARRHQPFFPRVFFPVTTSFVFPEYSSSSSSISRVCHLEFSFLHVFEQERDRARDETARDAERDAFLIRWFLLHRHRVVRFGAR